jgi:hypothetical protein
MKVTGDLRKLHNMELHKSYSPSNVVNIMKGGGGEMGQCTSHGRSEKCSQKVNKKTLTQHPENLNITKHYAKKTYGEVAI